MSQVQLKQGHHSFKFVCFNCNHPYNSTDRSPYIISGQFHSVCKVCLDDLCKSQDKETLKHLTKGQQSFKFNQAVKFQALEQLIKAAQEINHHGTPHGKESKEEEKKDKALTEMSEEERKKKWLLQYCISLDSKYHSLQVEQQKHEKDNHEKIDKYESSLQKMSQGFWKAKGDTQFLQENFHTISQFAQNIIENSPKWDYHSHGLGSIQDTIGLTQLDPVKWYGEGRLSNDFNSSPYDTLALTYLFSGNYEQAQRWYVQQLSKHHQNYQLMISLANTEYNLGRYVQAQKLYLKVIQLKPDMDKPYQQMAFIKWLKEDKPQQGRQWAEEALKINPRNIYAMYVQASTQQNLEERAQKLKELTEKHKNYTRAYNGLGKVYKQMKEWDKATKWYTKAIQINPKYEAPYYGLGIVNYLKGNNQQAIKWFEECVKINHKYQNALYGLGSVYQKLGNHQQALSWFNKCLQLNPGNSKAHNGIGTVYALLEHYQQAQQHFQKCIQLDPKHHLCLNSLGNIHFYQGNYEKAIQSYQKCIEINQKYGAPYNGLSNVYGKMGQEEQAKKWYEKKIEVSK